MHQSHRPAGVGDRLAHEVQLWRQNLSLGLYLVVLVRGRRLGLLEEASGIHKRTGVLHKSQSAVNDCIYHDSQTHIVRNFSHVT